MRPISFLVSMAFVALAGSSQLALAQQAMVPAMSVAGVETVPVDGDIFRYRAVLADGEDGGDLYIFTDAGNGWQQAVYARGLVWRGAMYGTEPWMEATEHGSLKIHSENSAIGRNRWEQVLTIAYRKNQFLVAGYTYSYYDTLDPNGAGQCDVNLLTGKGNLNGKTFKTSLPSLPVAEWTMETQPRECIVE
ncbi:hypothetical protein [Roseibium aggregatum]|uniref:Uncharacterized protein n=1 Tax=Roseibium aggregatum TaxID=187304 RepID=A0A939EDT9_9HYPH|nr:hypothetical protein [Roseibium aggregatum]MBN9670911.1 hypothetical protein [Roseibium aggregatum]